MRDEHCATNTNQPYLDFVRKAWRVGDPQWSREAQEITYTITSLMGEAGEIGNAWKKRLRDYGGELDEASRETIILECGDVLFYLTKLADLLGVTIEDVQDANIAKLVERTGGKWERQIG